MTRSGRTDKRAYPQYARLVLKACKHADMGCVQSAFVFRRAVYEYDPLVAT
jgi:hypothetical protein